MKRLNLIIIIALSAAALACITSACLYFCGVFDGNAPDDTVQTESAVTESDSELESVSEPTEADTTDAVSTEAESVETTKAETTKAETSKPATTEKKPVVTEATEAVTTRPEPTEPAVTESEPTEAVTTAPPVTEPVATEPVTTKPAVTVPAATEPAVTEAVTTKPVVTEPVVTDPPVTEPPATEPDLRQEASALESVLKPAQITVLRPTAPGTLTKSNSEAVIDYSNMADGYVMAKFTQDPGVRLKVQVTGPTTTYTYNVYPYEWTVFPLSDGNGAYTVKLFRNVVDNRYSTVLSASFTVSLNNEFAPFLRPNQYVNYENEPLTCDAASKVVNDGASMIDKVKAVYNFVVSNISYDYDKAATVQSGYLPDLDQILTSRKGICFDYAALMAGMLRSLDVPCKLVIGYAGSEYHAWISVWSEETGWIDGAIFFNGSNWQNMDPTFAATGSADSINRITYTSKYVY